MGNMKNKDSTNILQKESMAYKIVDTVIESIHNSSQKDPDSITTPYGLKENILANVYAISQKPVPFYQRLCMRYVSVSAIAGILVIVSITQINFIRDKLFNKSTSEITGSYTVNSFIATAIVKAKKTNETELVIAKTSGFIGLQ